VVMLRCCDVVGQASRLPPLYMVGGTPTPQGLREVLWGSLYMAGGTPAPQGLREVLWFPLLQGLREVMWPPLNKGSGKSCGAGVSPAKRGWEM
jgi:hypothetical protein